MSTEPTPDQLRAIPLEAIRAFALAELDGSSSRAIAERSGVGRTTLRGFLFDGRRPHPRIRRLLALWYWKETGGVGVGRYACEALLSEIPPGRREGAVRELEDFVRELHAKYRSDEE